MPILVLFLFTRLQGEGGGLFLLAGFRILSGMILHKLFFFKRVAFLCFFVFG